MFEYFAFIDESTAKKYRLCLIAIPKSDLPTIAKTLRELLLPGQRQIHMSKESDRRRKRIMDQVLKNESWKALILEISSDEPKTRRARQSLFLLAAVQPIWKQITHLVIEVSNERSRDRETLLWIRDRGQMKFDFEFAEPSTQPGLWVSDVIGWAYAKGGNWRKMISSRVEIQTTR